MCWSTWQTASLTICNSLEPGSRYKNGQIVVVDEEVQADMGLDGGLRTARVLVDMANSIFDYLQFTDDCPSLRASG